MTRPACVPVHSSPSCSECNHGVCDTVVRGGGIQNASDDRRGIVISAAILRSCDTSSHTITHLPNSWRLPGTVSSNPAKLVTAWPAAEHSVRMVSFAPVASLAEGAARSWTVHGAARHGVSRACQLSTGATSAGPQYAMGNDDS